MTELITSGRIPPVIAVGIDSASAALGYNAAGESPDKGEERAREFLAYPDPFSWPGLRDVRGAEFPAFLEHVVMPTIANKYRVMTGAANSALWGDSYAGSAALYIAIHYPLLFDKMIIESPSLQVGNGQLLRDTESITHVPQRIALGIGTAEESEAAAPGYNAAWLAMIRKLTENLMAASYLPPQVQLTVADGAQHTYPDFGKRMAAGLLFIYKP